MEPAEKRDSHDARAQRLTGYAALGCLLIGIVGVLAAVVSWGDNDWQAGGLCPIASAVAFGSLLVTLGR